ncbi:hypothetical protein N7G274_001853 [Stereocaulon virgatum]|uniref:Uncharacterized protein n=1 Tax=Stereocaulon virgatum TaxID=373712 RepID=A0ABR4ALM6_9LECA
MRSDTWDIWKGESRDSVRWKSNGLHLISCIGSTESAPQQIWKLVLEAITASLKKYQSGTILEPPEREMAKTGPVGENVSRGSLFAQYGAGLFVFEVNKEACLEEWLHICPQLGEIAKPVFVLWTTSTISGWYLG